MDFVDSFYFIELETKNTTDTATSASYPNLQIDIDIEGRLRTKVYDKRDAFNFPIVNFPIICSNIPAAPAYGVYISQFIRYSWVCGSSQDFHDRWLLITRKLLTQGFLLVITLKDCWSSPWRWLTFTEYVYNELPRMCSTCRKHFPVLSSFVNYSRFVNRVTEHVP